MSVAYLLSRVASKEAEPDRGVLAVLLEEPPSSLCLRTDDLLTSSMTPLDLGRP